MIQSRSMIPWALLIAGCAFTAVVNLRLSAQEQEKPHPTDRAEIERQKKSLEELVQLGAGLPEPYLKKLRQLATHGVFNPLRPDDKPNDVDEPIDVKPLMKKFDNFVSAKAVATAEVDDAERKLLALRYSAAVRVFRTNLAHYVQGRIDLDELLDAILLIRDAQLELGGKPADQLPILELCVEAAALRVGVEAQEYRIGRGIEQKLDFALYSHLDAQIRLLRAKKKLASK
jgi:hypothetical protein